MNKINFYFWIIVSKYIQKSKEKKPESKSRLSRTELMFMIERSLGSFDRNTSLKAPVGFEPTNQGFADPYNRPLCQGAIAYGQMDNIE